MSAATLLLAVLAAPAPVRVGSKNFAESLLLGEIFAQAIEARGLQVERRFGLGGSEVAFAALQRGDLDVYPEYAGTALLVLLREPPETAPSRAPGAEAAGAMKERRLRAQVSEAMAGRRLAWLPDLGFADDWVLAVAAPLARDRHLRQLGDLAAAAPLRAAFSPEFLGRADGLPGLEAAYGLHLADARPLSEPLKYQAIAAGEVDLIDAYSTDARLDTLGLVGLLDDRHFFPSYAAAPLARADLAVRAPAAQAALLALAGTLDLATMRRLNGAVERGLPRAEVARDFLASLGTGQNRPPAGDISRPKLAAFLRAEGGYLAQLLLRHLELTFGALAAATVVGLSLGLLASRRRSAELLVLNGVALVQTLPGLPLLAFLVPWLGIGVVPSLVALFLYALLPIAQATYGGLTAVDPDLLWVAQGQGMTEGQIARWIRFPLAVPVVLAGVRVAAVTTVGNATLAAFVGGGGLGEPILTGLTLNDSRLLLLGAVPAALLALGMDAVLAFAGRRLAPRR